MGGTPEKTGLETDDGMGVVTATLSSIVQVKKQRDRVLMGGTGVVNGSHAEAVSGVRGAPHAPRTAAIAHERVSGDSACRLRITTTGCLNMIKGM